MESLRFKIDGELLESGTPIHVLHRGLGELQSILDKPYLYLNNRQRMSAPDRASFFVRATDLRRGSLEADLEIVLQASQIIIPAVGAYSPETIWELTKETWNFLKHVFQIAKGGEMPTIQTNDNGTTNVVNGDQTINFNGPVYHVGVKALPHYKALNKLANAPGIDSIALGDSEATTVLLDEETKGLFSLPSVMDTETLSISCEIFDFNKYSNAGHLAIAEGQAIPSGRFPFSVVGDQSQRDYITSMMKREVSVVCLREQINDPLGGMRIRRLHVVSLAA
jgi:hypothetical protein